MSSKRVFAMIAVFGGVSVAWSILGTSVRVRTESLDESLSAEVAGMIGPEVLAQAAPYWTPKVDVRRNQDAAVPPGASEIDVGITHEDRYKGLLWYNKTRVAFSGKFTVPAANDVAAAIGLDNGFFIFHLPDGINGHDGLEVTVDGKPVELTQAQKQSGRLAVGVTRDAEHVVTVTFTTEGQDMWVYLPSGYAGAAIVDSVPIEGDMSELKKFSLTVTMNFTDVDYPKGTQSPSKNRTVDGGFEATWRYDSLVTNQAMGVVMPKRTNAGPIAARMSFFAPVSLMFFFTVLFAVVVLKKISLHPMHYLFVAAGFFAFHILLAYLADQINIHAAFWICAVVSVFLVVSYMRVVVGVKFAVTYVALAQMVYLVGFSYAFFWVGRTGLTVTIGAITTLFVLMQATARIDWSEVLNRDGPWINILAPHDRKPGDTDAPIPPPLKPPTADDPPTT